MANLCKTGKDMLCKKVGCSNAFYVSRSQIISGRKKFCSKSCLYSSGIQTNTFKVGHAPAGGGHTGHKHSEETKRIIGLSGIGRKAWNYIENRNLLAKTQERNDSAYQEWRKSVRGRDGWRCKMANVDCLEKVVAHHILPWAKFPELRYEINNGITLCVFHHPRKRSDEMRLSPFFQSLLINETSI